MTTITPTGEPIGTFDEFSPKRIILQTRLACIYLLSKWKQILFFALLCGIAIAIYSFFKKPDYAAEITFAVDEQSTQENKNNLSELDRELGIASSLDAGAVFSSLTNIVELMQSRLLIEKTLRSSVNINGKSLVFADFFLDSLDYRDKWMKKSPYYHIDFLSKEKNRQDSLFENGIMRNIYDVLIAKNIKLDRKGKGTTIISVTCISQNELFSKYFLEALLHTVTQYYIDTKTERARLNLAFIQARTDSIKNAYYDALHGRAIFVDALNNPIRQEASVFGERQQTNIQILKTSYIGLTQSLESAKTALMRDTPLIQYLDVPILPLKILKPNLIKRFLIFFAVGIFLSSVYFLLSRAYRLLIS